MSLLLTGKFADFYGVNANKKIESIFSSLLTAPWMSSGLAENNPFTTTLMIRLFGLLVDAGVLNGDERPAKPVKLWEPGLAIAKGKLPAFLKKIATSKHSLAKNLRALLSPKLQQSLGNLPLGEQDQARFGQQLLSELERLIRTANVCRGECVAGLPNGPAILTRMATDSSEYLIPELNRSVIHDFFAEELRPLETLSLEDIAQRMSSDIDQFRINDYDPSAAVVYWFVDGVSRARIYLDPEKHWRQLYQFAVDEFGKQRSRVVAKDAALMDPVAMAMAACLCARLRAISKDIRSGTHNRLHAMLPSTAELESAIVDLFQEQTPSGIWPKYFPLFHYQDAGSNFCYTFELLEAVLFEFGRDGSRLLATESVISGLEKAIHSCEVNRLQSLDDSQGKDTSYNGWNSGGNLQTLRQGQPESWATAVVHMFQWELAEVLSRHVQNCLLEKYRAIRPSRDTRIDSLLNIELLFQGEPAGLKETLCSSLIDTFKTFRGGAAERLRKSRAKGRLSALLFGPPGTSKTEVAKSIAGELDWPLVEIDPSHFLQNSFQNIYVQAENIFEDAMDMCGVVVLFDEMDALVQKRDGKQATDTEAKFLTTYMLPKLAKLHDRGRIVFLMATNFQANFDDAIKRAGRFDLLLCMGPPKLQDKCDAIHRFLGCDSDEQTVRAGQAILRLAGQDPWIEDQLTLYTYGDFKSFARALCSGEKLADAVATLEGLTVDAFREKVKADSKTVGLRFDDLNQLFENLSMETRRISMLNKTVFKTTNLTGVDLENPTVKYVLERQQSKFQ